MADEVETRVMTFPPGDINDLLLEEGNVVWGSTDPADKLAAVKGFVEGFELPEGSTASDVIQHAIMHAGHQMTFTSLLAITYMMGADFQIVVFDKADIDLVNGTNTESEGQ